jgi:hypothetical protein
MMAIEQLLPNDEVEQDRLDMVHHLFTLTLKGNLCASTLVNPQNILDLGKFATSGYKSIAHVRNRNWYRDLGYRQ